MAVLAYTTLGGIVAAAPNVASDVTTAFTQAQTSINNVEAAQIVAATVTDAKLASPNNTVWRTVGTDSGVFVGVTSAGTYWFANGGDAATASGSTNINGVTSFMPQSADYAVAGKTTTYRTNVVLSINATAPATTLTFGIHPVTLVSGGGGAIGYTLGAAVAGSTVAFASPVATSMTQSSSSGFAQSALTSNVPYVFGCVLTGALPGNHVSCAAGSLQVSHV